MRMPSAVCAGALLLLPATAAAGPAKKQPPAPRRTFDADVVVTINASDTLPVRIEYHLASSEASGTAAIDWVNSGHRWPDRSTGSKSASIFCMGNGSFSLDMSLAAPSLEPIPTPPPTDCAQPHGSMKVAQSCGEVGKVDEKGCNEKTCCWDALNNWCWRAPSSTPAQCNALPLTGGCAMADPGAGGCLGCMLGQDVDYPGSGGLVPPPGPSALFKGREAWEDGHLDVFESSTMDETHVAVQDREGRDYMNTVINTRTLSYLFREGSADLLVYRRKVTRFSGYWPAGWPVANLTTFQVEDRTFYNYTSKPPAWRLAPPQNLPCPAHA